MNEGQHLLHNTIEDNSAAEGCLYDHRERGLFVKQTVLEASGIPCPPLQGRDELLLKPDCLVDSIVMALLRKCRIFHRHRKHLLERIALLDRLPDSLESEEA